MSDLKEAYLERYEQVLKPMAEDLKQELRDCLSDVASRIDRLTVRPKSPDSFLLKAEKKEGERLKYSDPIQQIQDQLGARIVTLYVDDIEPIKEVVLKYFRPIELRDIIPDSESEFGYVGKHFILIIPSDIEPEGVPQALIPGFFELQVKTLFQHAWAEANHELSYKPSGELTLGQRRKVAFTAAQAWGADMIFNELQRELGLA